MAIVLFLDAGPSTHPWVRQFLSFTDESCVFHLLISPQITRFCCNLPSSARQIEIIISVAGVQLWPHYHC